MISNLREAAGTLKSVLGLTSEPVAVKFLTDAQQVSGYEALPNRRYCQMIMQARRGQKVILTAENIACPAAAAAFGFKPLPPKLASGEMLAAFGIFGSPEAGKATVDSMRRLKQGEYAAVALSPLEKADYEPDVVVVEAAIEQLMWIALAARYETGGRAEFTTAILQATCEDTTVLPFLTGELNATLGCYGCREATDMGSEETVIGFPGGLLDAVVRGLHELGRKALPRVRAKGAYQRLAGCVVGDTNETTRSASST